MSVLLASSAWKAPAGQEPATKLVASAMASQVRCQPENRGGGGMGAAAVPRESQTMPRHQGRSTGGAAAKKVVAPGPGSAIKTVACTRSKSSHAGFAAASD